MNRNKGDYITITFGVILLLIILGIAYTLILTPTSPPITPSEKTTIPTTIPQKIPTSAQSGPQPILSYDEGAEERLIDKLISPPPLSYEDSLAKNTLLQTNLKGNNSGVAYENENIRIEYISSVDHFIVEVKTIDIAKAKSEANVWFINQGLSQKGLCDLPIRFMPSFDVSQMMGESGMIFNPLPNSC
jgi:hypothetical protein